MAQQFQKRERFKNLEARRRYHLRGRVGLFTNRYWWLVRQFVSHDDWIWQDKKRQADLANLKRKFEKSVYKGICTYSKEFFHPIWRNAGKKICRLYLIGEDARAENLDPQPKRLGIMWDID
jgi:hypothetical protein